MIYTSIDPFCDGFRLTIKSNDGVTEPVRVEILSARPAKVPYGVIYDNSFSTGLADKILTLIEEEITKEFLDAKEEKRC